MLTAYMTEQEIEREVLTDMVNAFRFEDANRNKFRRLVLKSTRFPVYFHYLYTSPRKNRWLILLEARSKKEVLDMSRITFATTHETPHGLYCVMVSWFEGKPQLILYPPHFFSRFKKRMGLEETGIKLMFRFFRFNSSYVYSLNKMSINTENYTMEIIGSTENGVALGFLTVNNNILFKTFITYDMLKGQQVETCFKNKELLNEIHNKP